MFKQNFTLAAFWSADFLCHLHLQFNVEDEEKKHVKWYKNYKFWTAVASVLITEALLISAIVMVVFYKHHKVIWFEWWRWLFFFSGTMTTRAALAVPAHDACRLA